MDRRIVCRQWMAVLVGALACLTVAQGQTVYTQGANLHVGANLYVGNAVSGTGYASIGDDLSVGDDIDSAYVGYNSYPIGFFDYVLATWDVAADRQVFGNLVECYQFVAVDPSYFIDDLTVYGKLHANGGIDPPYLLCDKQTRKEIVERVTREVPPEKQGGAALFFNADANQLETYVPAEGKFYNLQGSVVHTIQPVGTSAYKTIYYLDGLTGEVKTTQRTVYNRYKVRQGYRLDEKTGQFVNAKTGETATKEDALSLYVAGEDKLYDLRGNPIVEARASRPAQFETEHYFDPLTGQVKTTQKRVYDRHAIKEGFALDKKTGQFVNKATGQVVSREEAVELKQAPSTQTTR